MLADCALSDGAGEVDSVSEFSVFSLTNVVIVKYWCAGMWGLQPSLLALCACVSVVCARGIC